MYPWQCKKCPRGVICRDGLMKLCPWDIPYSDIGNHYVIFERMEHDSKDF